MTNQTPSIGRIVLFRSKNGPYDQPAIITATSDTLWEEGVKLFAETYGRKGVKALSSVSHVHLQVFTAGQREGSETFAQHDVPMASEAEPEPGSWRWPAMVLGKRVDKPWAAPVVPAA